MKFFIKTFGCQMNVNDSEKMIHILKSHGHELLKDESGSDFIIVNTCAVREKAQDKIFSYIGRQPEHIKIIVSGCVAQSERDALIRRNPRISFVVGTHQYHHINTIVDDNIQKKSQGVRVGFRRNWEESVPDVASRISSVSGYISIMEGCDNFCSYCIVPFTRGREKHRPFRLIVQEAEYLYNQGYQEIILLGQNVNNWEDPGENKKFPQLLDHLATEVDVRWFRFITSYPGYHDDDLMEIVGKHKNIARHIHFPAQSGSTRVLKRMKRIYSRDQYLRIIRNFKKAVPDMKFSSDFIVGFPNETEHDFNLTLSLLEAVEYESVFSFIYSPRPHTHASQWGDTISHETKKERLYRLQDLQEKIQLKNNRRIIGSEIDVLVTQKHPRKIGDMIGRTESYRVVNFRGDVPVGTFQKVVVTEAGPHSLRGNLSPK